MHGLDEHISKMIEVIFRETHGRHDAQHVLFRASESNQEVLVLHRLKYETGDTDVKLNAPHQAAAANLDAALKRVHNVVKMLRHDLTETGSALLDLLLAHNIKHLM